MYGEAQGTCRLADALDEITFADSRLADEDEVLFASHEAALGQGFDLGAWDQRVETPIEFAQGFEIAEAGVFDALLQTAFAPHSRLVGEQAMQEVEVRSAVLFGVAQGGVEVLGGDRNAQGSEVGEDWITQVRARRRFRRACLWVLLRMRFH